MFSSLFASDTTEELQSTSASESFQGEDHNSLPPDVATDSAICADATEESRTTIMVRNIPNSKKRDALIEFLGEKHGLHEIRLIYLPCDFTRKRIANKGYAYVDMQNPQAALQLMNSLNGHSWGGNSTKEVAVDWATKTQGYDSIVELYKNNPINNMEVPHDCKPAIFENGSQLDFPTADVELSKPSGLTKRKAKQTNTGAIEDHQNGTVAENREAHLHSSLGEVGPNTLATEAPQNIQSITGATLLQEDTGVEANTGTRGIPNPYLPLKIPVVEQDLFHEFEPGEKLVFDENGIVQEVSEQAAAKGIREGVQIVKFRERFKQEEAYNEETKARLRIIRDSATCAYRVTFQVSEIPVKKGFIHYNVEVIAQQRQVGATW